MAHNHDYTISLHHYYYLANQHVLARTLFKDFLIMVVIAALIAIPLAYYYVNKWYNSFEFHTEFSAGSILLVLVVMLGIIILTTAYRIIRAALENPINALRYE